MIVAADDVKEIEFALLCYGGYQRLFGVFRDADEFHALLKSVGAPMPYIDPSITGIEQLLVRVLALHREGRLVK